jgi:hypothetical protein
MQAGLGTTLRCAGGWVRDKLMGRSSLDIDIALDNLLGREFADRINDYLQAHVSVNMCCTCAYAMGARVCARMWVMLVGRCGVGGGPFVCV